MGRVTPARNGSADPNSDARLPAPSPSRRNPLHTVSAQTATTGSSRLTASAGPSFSASTAPTNRAETAGTATKTTLLATRAAELSFRAPDAPGRSCALYTRYTATASTYQTPVILQQTESPPATPAANSQPRRPVS